MLTGVKFALPEVSSFAAQAKRSASAKRANFGMYSPGFISFLKEEKMP
jgi:hypothetical protein